MKEVEQQYLILGFDFACEERTWRIVVGEEQLSYWEQTKGALWTAPWPLPGLSDGSEGPTKQEA